LIGTDLRYSVTEEPLLIQYTEKPVETIPEIMWLKKLEAQRYVGVEMEKKQLLPDFSISYFAGSNFFNNAKLYHGFEAGISVPLFTKPQKSKIKASELALGSTRLLTMYETDLLKMRQQELLNERKKLEELMNYFQQDGQKLIDEMNRTANLSYEKGEIDFFRFVASIETALQIKLEYFDNILKYNNITIELNHLSK